MKLRLAGSADADALVEFNCAMALETGHTRILVLEDRATEPAVGHVRDTFMLPEDELARDCARPAFRLSAETPVYEALTKMRAKSVQLGVVMEGSAVKGVITLADILEHVPPRSPSTVA